MTDSSVAQIVRQLSEALQARAHSRSIEDIKRVAELQTVLCRTVNEEKKELIQQKYQTDE